MHISFSIFEKLKVSQVMDFIGAGPSVLAVGPTCKYVRVVAGYVAGFCTLFYAWSIVSLKSLMAIKVSDSPPPPPPTLYEPNFN